MGGSAGCRRSGIPPWRLSSRWSWPASSVWDLDQLSGRRYRLASGAVTVGCRIAMSVTMAFMLLIMI